MEEIRKIESKKEKYRRNTLASNHTNLTRERNNLNMCRGVLTTPVDEVLQQGAVCTRVNMR